MSTSNAMTFGRYDYGTFGVYATYAASSLVIPVVLVAMAADLGFPLDEEGGKSQGGAIHAVRSVAITLTLVLSGFLAGRLGLRVSMGVSAALMGVGIIVAAVAPSYGVMVLAVLIAGLGEGVIEGLGTPVAQQLHREEPGRYINFTHAFWPIGVVSTVLLVGWLLTADVSWRWIVLGVGVLSLLPAAVYFLPRRSAKVRAEAACLDVAQPLAWSTVVAQCRDVVRRPRFWLFFAAMFFVGGGEFGLTFWTASYIQLEFEQTAFMGGLGLAVFSTGMVVTRVGWAWLLRQHHLYTMLIVSAAVGAVISLPIVWLTSMGWLFVVLFVAGVAVGPLWPSVQSYSTDRLPGADTTMLFILLSCAGVPGCGVFAWIMGEIGDKYDNLRVSYYLVAGCFALVATLLLVDRLIPPRRKPVANSQ